MSRVHYAVLAIPVAGLAAAGGYWYAMSRMPAMPAEPAAAKPATQGDRKVLYWYDPMFPQQKFDKPGKSPFMDMRLVPKYADEGGDEGTVSISPRSRAASTSFLPSSAVVASGLSTTTGSPTSRAASASGT